MAADRFQALPRWQRWSMMAAAFVVGWALSSWVPTMVFVFALGVLVGLELGRWVEGPEA